MDASYRSARLVHPVNKVEPNDPQQHATLLFLRGIGSYQPGYLPVAGIEMPLHCGMTQANSAVYSTIQLALSRRDPESPDRNFSYGCNEGEVVRWLRMKNYQFRNSRSDSFEEKIYPDTKVPMKYEIWLRHDVTIQANTQRFADYLAQIAIHPLRHTIVLSYRWSTDDDEGTVLSTEASFSQRFRFQSVAKEPGVFKVSFFVPYEYFLRAGGMSTTAHKVKPALRKKRGHSVPPPNAERKEEKTKFGLMWDSYMTAGRFTRNMDISRSVY